MTKEGYRKSAQTFAVLVQLSCWFPRVSLFGSWNTDSAFQALVRLFSTLWQELLLWLQTFNSFKFYLKVMSHIPFHDSNFSCHHKSLALARWRQPVGMFCIWSWHCSAFCNLCWQDIKKFFWKDLVLTKPNSRMCLWVLQGPHVGEVYRTPSKRGLSWYNFRKAYWHTWQQRKGVDKRSVHRTGWGGSQMSISSWNAWGPQFWSLPTPDVCCNNVWILHIRKTYCNN